MNRRKNKAKISLKQRFLLEQAQMIKKKINSELKSRLLGISRELEDLTIERSRIAEYIYRGNSRVAGLLEEMWEIEMFERKDAALTKEYYKKNERYLMWKKEMQGIDSAIMRNGRSEEELSRALKETKEKMREKMFPGELKKNERVYEMYKERRDKDTATSGNESEISGGGGEEEEERDWYRVLEQNEEVMDMAKKRYDIEIKLQKLDRKSVV